MREAGAASANGFNTVFPQDTALYEKRLTGTRWAAGIGVGVMTLVSTRVLDVPLAEAPLLLLGAVVLLYNALFRWERLTFVLPSFERRILVQIVLDWLSMLVFVHLTGGITSPALVLFFLHVIIVTILVPGQSPYVYAAVIVVAVTIVAALETRQMIFHYTVIPGIPASLYQNAAYVGAQIAFFSVALGATAYITDSIMQPLRQRERQLMSLYETTRAVSSTLDVNSVLAKLSEYAAKALEARCVAIYLLERNGKSLKLAGVSCADAGSADVITVDALTARVLDGAIETLPSVSPTTRTMLLPIIGERTLGVLKIDSAPMRILSKVGVGYVRALAGQGAVAIQNAMAHEALQAAEKQREQFVHVVTHELRSPVVGAQSLARVLVGGLAGTLTDQQRDIIERLSRRMDSLLVLLNDLLSVMAGKSQELHATLVDVDAASILRDSVENFVYPAKEKRITLRWNVPDRPIHVLATQDGLTRIYDNLIGNAVKYTGSDGCVWVSLREDGLNAILQVSDTGIGIPADALVHLGQEFYRASNAKEAGVVGTGLGLATVKQMVEYFGGQMTVESEVGKGSAFKISLPVAK